MMVHNEQRKNKKKGINGKKKSRNKSLLRIPTYFFHCSSHLGLIKGDENWSHNHSTARAQRRGKQTSEAATKGRKVDKVRGNGCELWVEKQEKRFQRK
jgi:hypothetical protein